MDKEQTLNQLIRLAVVYGIGVGQGYSKDVDDKFITDAVDFLKTDEEIKEYAVALSAPSGTGMRWVKASGHFPIDGKPESLDDVIMRRIDNKRPIVNVFQYLEHWLNIDTGSSFFSQIQYSDIEWLDESAPIQKTVEELRSAFDIRFDTLNGRVIKYSDDRKTFSYVTLPVIFSWFLANWPAWEGKGQLNTLYKELQERHDFLKTAHSENRMHEISLVITRIQQLMLESLPASPAPNSVTGVSVTDEWIENKLKDKFSMGLTGVPYVESTNKEIIDGAVKDEIKGAKWLRRQLRQGEEETK